MQIKTSGEVRGIKPKFIIIWKSTKNKSHKRFYVIRSWRPTSTGRDMRCFEFSITQIIAVGALFIGAKYTKNGSQLSRKSGPYLLLRFCDYNHKSIFKYFLTKKILLLLTGGISSNQILNFFLNRKILFLLNRRHIFSFLQII